MEILALLTKLGIYLGLGVILAFALGVVVFKNLFHSALSLAAALIGIAGIYVVLHAEFVAAVQILLYVGGIITLIIFAIMLTENFSNIKIKQTNKQLPIAIIASLAFVVVMAKLIITTPWPIIEAAKRTSAGVMEIGTALMGIYVFPFEVISVVLIAALIGTVIIAKTDSSEEK